MKPQYTKNQKAWQNLGLDTSKLPKLEDIEKAITPELQKIIKKHKCQMVITPAINKDFTFKDLIAAFDKKQKTETWVYDDLWNQYDLTQDLQVRFVFMGAKNDYNAKHLYFTNQTLDEQRQSVKDSEGEALNPVEYIILQAIYRPKTLDDRTWLRFAGLENKTVGGASLVGGVDSAGDGLRLVRSRGYAISVNGVGVSVGLELKPLDSSLPSSFSSTDLQANTEAINKLTDTLERIFKV